MTRFTRAKLFSLCLFCLGPSGHALADTLPFAPTYLEAQQAAAARTATGLEQTLRSLPDVVSARVHISHVDASHAPLDRPLPAPRVSVWLKLRGQGPADKDVRALLSAAVPDATHESIHIARHTAAPVATQPIVLREVGPFLVAAESAPRLRGLLAVLLTINVLLCAVLVSRLRPRRP